MNGVLCQCLRKKPRSVAFFRKQVTFLALVVSQDGVSTGTDKTQQISEGPAPQDVHEVRSILGLVSYYRRAIHHLCCIAEPPINLTEKD